MPKIPGREKTVTVQPAVRKNTMVEDYQQRWSEKKVEVEASDGSLRPVRATVIGNALAVHPALNGVQFSLTHVPTKLQILSMPEAESLVMVAEILWDSFPMSFRKKTKEEVLEKLPPWVRTWIHAIREKQQFIEPKEYKESSSTKTT